MIVTGWARRPRPPVPAARPRRPRRAAHRCGRGGHDGIGVMQPLHRRLRHAPTAAWPGRFRQRVNRERMTPIRSGMHEIAPRQQSDRADIRQGPTPCHRRRESRAQAGNGGRAAGVRRRWMRRLQAARGTCVGTKRGGASAPSRFIQKPGPARRGGAEGRGRRFTEEVGGEGLGSGREARSPRAWSYCSRMLLLKAVTIGSLRYWSTVRSPLEMIVSTGMPGTRRSAMPGASSARAISMRTL